MRAFIAALSLGLLLVITAMTGADASRNQGYVVPQAAAPPFLFDRHGVSDQSYVIQATAEHVRPAARSSKHRHKIEHRETGSSQIVSHPSGCPSRAFCGCGVAMHVFGKPIRDLWLAANWFRFPSASPAAGMVAVRKHHVMAIIEAHGDGTATVYDPNSGGHLTRIHRRSLAGYRVVDPRHGRQYAGT